MSYLVGPLKQLHVIYLIQVDIQCSKPSFLCKSCLVICKNVEKNETDTVSKIQVLKIHSYGGALLL